MLVDCRVLLVEANIVVLRNKVAVKNCILHSEEFALLAPGNNGCGECYEKYKFSHFRIDIFRF